MRQPKVQRPLHSVLIAGLVLIFTLSGCMDVGPQLPQNPEGPTPVKQKETTTVPAELLLLEITPSQGSTQGFTQVELRGEGLLDVNRVTFGGTDAIDFLAVSDTLIVAHTPVRPHGVVDVQVTDSDGKNQTLASAYRFVDTVQISEVNPSEIHLFGGEAVTILGQGFSNDSVVLIGEKKALEINVVNDGTIVAIAPEGDRSGPVNVLVSSSAGTALMKDGLSYVTPPILELITPPAGLVGTDVRVDLQGLGFTKPLLVTVDGIELDEMTRHDASHLTITVPARDEPGPVDIAVVTAFGTTVADNAFTFYQPGDTGLLGLYPSVGSTLGGDLVTISHTQLPKVDTPHLLFGDQKAEIVATAWNDNYFLVRTPPSAEANQVDVTIDCDGETFTLNDAFEYVRRPQIIEVKPNFGSQDGGERITLIGHGFSDTMTVRIGALAATNLQRIDDSTIEVTTPKGAPGLANVTVIEEGHIDSLKGGYLYQGDAEIWAVSPPTGAVSGGTIVTLYGNGLENATAVFFDGVQASVVEQTTPTKMVLRTPPGELGAVTVRVETPSGTVRRDRAFSYFDPSSDGGLWGGPIDGNVNITVFDLWYRDRISDVKVLLGDSTESPHQGTTDINGQVTLGALDLAGPQRLTVVKEGYQIGSLVGFDAQNVAIGLEPVPTCEMIEDMPCGEGGNEGATTDAKVNHLFKGVKTPWGDCEGHEGLERDLCEPCKTNADCEAGQCVTIPDKGSFCSYECLQPSDCPDEFLCLPVPGDETLQCVPSAGEYKTYCDITVSSMDAQDPIPFPGIEVDDLGQIELATRLGDYAIFCWSGMLKNGRFTPEILGVARGLHSTEEGGMVKADIDMNYPLKQDVEIVLDRPAIGPSEEQETTYVRIALDLGPEGILDFPLLQATGRGELKTKLPASLAGELYNAEYTLVARAKSQFEPTAESIVVANGIADIRNDRAWKLEQGAWSAAELSPDNVNAMSALDDVIFAVGDGGFIARSYGNTWAHSPNQAEHDLLAVTFAAAAPIAGGENGTLIRFDGVTWKNEESPTQSDIRALSGLPSGELFLVASQTLHINDGTSWKASKTAPVILNAVLALSPTDVWVAGNEGFIGHFDGESLETIYEGEAFALNALSRASNGTIYAAGDRGTLLNISNGKVSSVETNLQANLLALGSDGARTWAVGQHTTILEITQNGIANLSPEGTGSTLRAIAGWADNWWTLGSHELVLGPMMAIPEQVNIRLEDDGSAVTTWQTQGGEDSHFNLITAGSSVGPCEACGMLFMLPYREWRATVAGGIEGARIPNLQSLIGRAHFTPGNKTVTVIRAYVDGPFDFDNNQGSEFIGSGWKSWATTEVSIPVPTP